MIAEIKFENFTAFKKLRIEFSAGINIFVGSNGTGKTHILKTVYASCDITKSKKNFAEKILRVFMPSASQLGRLVKRQKVSARGSVEVFRSWPIRHRKTSPLFFQSCNKNKIGCHYRCEQLVRYTN